MWHISIHTSETIFLDIFYMKQYNDFNIFLNIMCILYSTLRTVQWRPEFPITEKFSERDIVQYHISQILLVNNIWYFKYYSFTLFLS